MTSEGWGGRPAWRSHFPKRMRPTPADALAGVDLLRDIRAAFVGVAGMSQGGGIAALAAVQSPHVRFVAAGSVSGITTAAQNDNVVRNFLLARGGSRALLDSVMVLRRRVDAFHRTRLGREELEADLAAFPPRDYFMDWWLPTPPLERYDADVVADRPRVVVGPTVDRRAPRRRAAHRRRSPTARSLVRPATAWPLRARMKHER